MFLFHKNLAGLKPTIGNLCHNSVAAASVATSNIGNNYNNYVNCIVQILLPSDREISELVAAVLGRVSVVVVVASDTDLEAVLIVQLTMGDDVNVTPAH